MHRLNNALRQSPAPLFSDNIKMTVLKLLLGTVYYPYHLTNHILYPLQSLESQLVSVVEKNSQSAASAQGELTKVQKALEEKTKAFEALEKQNQEQKSKDSQVGGYIIKFNSCQTLCDYFWNCKET